MNMKKRDIITGLVLAVMLVIASFFASRYPDGLERVSFDKNFKERENPPIITVIPGYVWPGKMNEKLAVFFGGVAGISIVFYSVCLVGRFLKREEQ